MVSKIFKLTNENYDVNPNLKTHAVSECPVYGFVFVYIYVTSMIFGFAMKILIKLSLKCIIRR